MWRRTGLVTRKFHGRRAEMTDLSFLSLGVLYGEYERRGLEAYGCPHARRIGLGRLAGSSNPKALQTPNNRKVAPPAGLEPATQ